MLLPSEWNSLWLPESHGNYFILIGICESFFCLLLFWGFSIEYKSVVKWRVWKIRVFKCVLSARDESDPTRRVGQGAQVNDVPANGTKRSVRCKRLWNVSCALTEHYRSNGPMNLRGTIASRLQHLSITCHKFDCTLLNLLSGVRGKICYRKYQI